ncbi:hypothetical protein JTB14_030801 [Gonioctena quinquepunctata]|nr:hypothetical protein JTB14_030801 [Gonioctena quinquepunctata]
MEQKIDRLLIAASEIKTDIQSIKTTVGDLRRENCDLKKEVNELKQKINNLERRQEANQVVFHGLSDSDFANNEAVYGKIGGKETTDTHSYKSQNLQDIKQSQQYHELTTEENTAANEVPAAPQLTYPRQDVSRGSRTYSLWNTKKSWNEESKNLIIMHQNKQCLRNECDDMNRYLDDNDTIVASV